LGIVLAKMRRMRRNKRPSEHTGCLLIVPSTRNLRRLDDHHPHFNPSILFHRLVLSGFTFFFRIAFDSLSTCRHLVDPIVRLSPHILLVTSLLPRRLRPLPSRPSVLIELASTTLQLQLQLESLLILSWSHLVSLRACCISWSTVLSCSRSCINLSVSLFSPSTASSSALTQIEKRK